MPTAPRNPCSHQPCPGFAEIRGLCKKHHAEIHREIDSRRGSAASRGYDRRWQKARDLYLAEPEHALCLHCKATGRDTTATVVDHIVPHRNDRELFWNQMNWQPLCKACHDRKTAREDGRWTTREGRSDSLPMGDGDRARAGTQEIAKLEPGLNR